MSRKTKLETPRILHSTTQISMVMHSCHSFRNPVRNFFAKFINNRSSVIRAVLICAIILIFTGCSKSEKTASRTQKTTVSVSDVIQQRIAEEDSTNAAYENTISAPAETSANIASPAQATAVTNTLTQSDPTTLSAVTASASVATTNTTPQPLVPATATTPAHKKPDPIKTENVSVDVDLTTLSSTMVYSEVLNIMTYPETYVGKTIKMRGIFAYYHDEQTGQYYFGCIIQDATACCAQGIEFILTDDYLFPDDYPEEGEIVTVAGEFLIYQENDLNYFTLKDSKLLI